jgi:hypothetical protein
MASGQLVSGRDLAREFLARRSGLSDLTDRCVTGLGAAGVQAAPSSVIREYR